MPMAKNVTTTRSDNERDRVYPNWGSPEVGTADKSSGLRGQLENTIFLTKTNKTLASQQGKPRSFLAEKQADALTCIN